MSSPAGATCLFTSGDGAQHLFSIKRRTRRTLTPTSTSISDAEGVGVYFGFHLLTRVAVHLGTVSYAMHGRIVPIAVLGAHTLTRTPIESLSLCARLVDTLTVARVVVHTPIPGTRVSLGTETLAQDCVEFEWVAALL